MSWSERRAALAALAGLSGLALAGCGFELRRPPVMGFRRIALAGFATRSPLGEDFRRTLAKTLDVTESPAQAEVVLHAIADRREKSVVASTSAAQVRELQLRLKFDFRVATPAGRELIAPSALLLTRDLSYSEASALGKAEEEAELYREMQADVVAQVMRRLASITP